MGLTRRQLEGETRRWRKKMVEELRKRLGESLKVKTSNCEDLRLTYFPARGRAEISRLILAHAGLKFDDIRLSGEDFGKVKPLLPYGSMPILEYKGEVICESMAIAKFLAELCNVAGNTILEKAKAEEVVLAINGIFESVAKCLFAPEGEKAGLKKKLIEETLPQKFGQLEGRLCLNGGQFSSRSHQGADRSRISELMLNINLILLLNLNRTSRVPTYSTTDMSLSTYL